MPIRFPLDFTPDLRRLKSWPSMKGSLWRQPYLVELTHAEAYRLVKNSINGQNLKILDVGCGTGFMSLELARTGHDVLGLDHNQELIRIAKRTAKTDPYRRRGGSLKYEVRDFKRWSYRSETFDVVLFSRALHDMPDPEKTLAKAHRLLKDGGTLACLEYAYDRMNQRAAIWLYQIRRALEVAGWYSPPHLPENPEAGVDKIMKEALSDRKGHINTFEEMRQPLERLFHRKRFSWHCYYYWGILSDMRIPDANREKKLASLFKGMEQFLIDAKEIQPLLFRFVGTKASD